MTDSDEMNEPAGALASAGEAWTAEEEDLLVQELKAGLTIDDIAASHGRTRGAITSRVSAMFPLRQGEELKGQGRVRWLRERLIEGNYDWRTPLATRVGRSWSTQDADYLRQAWQDEVSLPDIATRLKATELQVVQQMVRLGIGENTVAVTDRLKFAPEGPVAMRRRLALDTRSAMVHLLLILQGDELAHVSVHSSAVAAEAALPAAQESLDPSQGKAR